MSFLGTWASEQSGRHLFRPTLSLYKIFTTQPCESLAWFILSSCLSSHDGPCGTSLAFRVVAFAANCLRVGVCETARWLSNTANNDAFQIGAPLFHVRNKVLHHSIVASNHSIPGTIIHQKFTCIKGCGSQADPRTKSVPSAESILWEVV